MPPSSYELDTVAANLIERMEGARRTWQGDPDAAAAGLSRIAEESIDRVSREYDAIMGSADGWPAVLRRELMETFLPRYIRLATEHNALEADGYGAWRGGDPVARIIATAGAILGALAIETIFRHPITLILLVAALFVPLMPEIRAWYHRRRYVRLLQEAVDDMGRIQSELDRYVTDDGYTRDHLEQARAQVRAVKPQQELP
ncbi:MAG: hypothetical protein AAFV53_31890 [Myxococcota bacterium]